MQVCVCVFVDSKSLLTHRGWKQVPCCRSFPPSLTSDWPMTSPKTRYTDCCIRTVGTSMLRHLITDFWYEWKISSQSARYCRTVVRAACLVNGTPRFLDVLLHIMGSNTMIFAVLKAWLICRPYAVLWTEKFLHWFLIITDVWQSSRTVISTIHAHVH